MLKTLDPGLRQDDGGVRVFCCLSQKKPVL